MLGISDCEVTRTTRSIQLDSSRGIMFVSEAKVICNRCSIDLPRGARFCTACGVSVKEVATSAISQCPPMHFLCGTRNNRIPEGKNFCRFYGAQATPGPTQQLDLQPQRPSRGLISCGIATIVAVAVSGTLLYTCHSSSTIARPRARPQPQSKSRTLHPPQVEAPVPALPSVRVPVQALKSTRPVVSSPIPEPLAAHLKGAPTAARESLERKPARQVEQQETHAEATTSVSPQPGPPAAAQQSAATQTVVEELPPHVQLTQPEPSPLPVPQKPPPRSLAYSGPRRGVIVWSGTLEKDGSFTVQGGEVSIGSLSGRLPGVPVIIAKFDARDFALAEVPGPRNNWNRLTARSKSRRHTDRDH